MAKRKFDESMSDHIQISNQPKFLHNSILLEDGVLQFDFMTSLQNIVMAKIITNLCLTQTIQQGIVNYRDGEEWQKIERKVITRVFELSLPNSITKKLESIVPTVAKSILDWISYHDEHVFSSNEYSAKDMISNIAWTARGRIDYAQTAKNILADQNSYLSDDHKYILACTYCLEDDIPVLASKVINKNYLVSMSIFMHPMVDFWTKPIMDDYTLPSYFRSPYFRNISNYEHVIKSLISNIGVTTTTLNEVPVKYMWNKLNDEEKARNIIPLIKNLSNQDLGYTLISSLNYEQQQEVFKECSDIILDGIFNDWLRKEYFLPTAIHLLDIMHPLSYLHLLKMITKEKNKNYHEEGIYNQYKSIFKQLWQKGSSCLKDFIFDYENGWPFCKLVTCSLSWERDMDIIEVVFNDLDTQQKRNLIFKKHGLRYCSNLILADKWCLLEVFIKHTLSSETDIDLLKEMLIKRNGHQIAVIYLKQGLLCDLEHFMSWALKTEESINHFRRSLAHTKSQTTLELIIDGYENGMKVDFTELESHFKWCAKDDVEVLNQFKTEFFTLYPGKLITKLIIVDMYELLDQVFNWCFSHNLQQIEKIKSNLYKSDRDPTWPIRSLTFTLIENDNSFKMLNKFIGWLFNKEEDIQEFKKWALFPVEGKCSLISNFFVDEWALMLDESNFSLADKFINWCVPNSEAAYTFKNSFMLSTDMVEFIKSGRCNTQDDLKLLIKWFNPSKETVQIFKTLFLEKDCPDNFYELLDNFIKSQGFTIEDYQENVLEVSEVNLDDLYLYGVQE